MAVTLAVVPVIVPAPRLNRRGAENFFGVQATANGDASGGTIQITATFSGSGYFKPTWMTAWVNANSSAELQYSDEGTVLMYSGLSYSSDPANRSFVAVELLQQPMIRIATNSQLIALCNNAAGRTLTVDFFGIMYPDDILKYPAPFSTVFR